MRVLVTGGTSGLGLAMAAALASDGATVALTGRSAERAEEVAAGLAGAVGVGLDVRDETSVAAAVGQVWSRFGGIDLLVNNAGIGMRTVNPEFLSRIMAADLRDTAVTVNLLLPGGPTVSGMVPPGGATGGRRFLAPTVMGPPIVWLASDEAAGVHDERIVAADFERWLGDRRAKLSGGGHPEEG